ncbi:sec-independent protein translocase protein TATA, chloroplastic [Rhodamnia argentea]|uniref:Sec-independent protein translocase protein TATA, chloroplastic n=1 Tax=Rhodamnia argentea TaxID=178133 RepID=A0A8B8PJA2_9MYRT|nr:sec-independent protein translocase protein TATA, chloroplastic [Rhodamnia argentea]
MEICSSLSLPLSPSSSLPRPPSTSLPLSSSSSTFFFDPPPPPPPPSSSSSLSRSIKTRDLRRHGSNSPVIGLGRRRNQRAKRGLTCNALFGLGVPELVVIAGVAALVFGPKKLPEVGKSIGKTVKSFQQAAKEFESELKKEPESLTETSIDKPKEVAEEGKIDSSSKESI